jgi:hypothetical protein
LDRQFDDSCRKVGGHLAQVSHLESYAGDEVRGSALGSLNTSKWSLGLMLCPGDMSICAGIQRGLINGG